MSHLRVLNQQQNDDQGPFWEWVEAMGGGPHDEERERAEASSSKKHDGHDHENEKDLYHASVHDEEDTEMPPPEYDGEDPPTPPEEYPMMDHHLPDRTVDGDHKEKNKDGDDNDNDRERCGSKGRRGRGGRCGRGGGGPGAWGHHHPHPHHHGGPPHAWGEHGPGGGRGGFGGWGRGRGGPGGMFRGRAGPPPFAFGGGFPFGPFGGPGGPHGPHGPHHRGGPGGPQNWDKWMKMAQKFAERLGLDPSQIPTGAFGPGADDKEDGVDFSPLIDVYSTPTEYVVHVALPGANKEDVAVTWDENEAALTVAGVVTRGVDEELANQLALGERPVGVFSRKIRLGDQEHPARVDQDGIRAGMEEGVLKIRVRKVEPVQMEVKKVEVQ